MLPLFFAVQSARLATARRLEALITKKLLLTRGPGELFSAVPAPEKLRASLINDPSIFNWHWPLASDDDLLAVVRWQIGKFTTLLPRK